LICIAYSVAGLLIFSIIFSLNVPTPLVAALDVTAKAGISDTFNACLTASLAALSTFLVVN